MGGGEHGRIGSTERVSVDRWRLRGSHFRGATPRFEERGLSIEAVATGERDETRRDDRIDSRSNRDPG